MPEGDVMQPCCCCCCCCCCYVSGIYIRHSFLSA